MVSETMLANEQSAETDLQKVKEFEKEAERRNHPPRHDPGYSVLRILEKAVSDAISAIKGDVGLAVDVGCGSRPYDHLVRRKAAKVVGVDLEGNPLADLTCRAGDPLPYADGSADLAVNFQVLEHIAEPHDFLVEICRILKPGGHLVLSTHGLFPYHPSPIDYHRWTRAGLIYQIEQAGFTVTSTIDVEPGLAGILQFTLATLKMKRHTFTNIGKGALASFAWLMSFVMDALYKFHWLEGDSEACVYVVTARKNS